MSVGKLSKEEKIKRAKEYGRPFDPETATMNSMGNVVNSASDMCGKKPLSNKKPKNQNLMYTKISDEYYSELLQSAIDNLFVPFPKSDEEVADRLLVYFRNCYENKLRPTYEGMAFAVGVSADTWNNWAKKARDDMPDGSRFKLAKRSRELMHIIESNQAMDYKMNPTLYIFRSKNYYGMKDQQEIVQEIKDPLGEKMSAEELMEIIDSDVVETE